MSAIGISKEDIKTIMNNEQTVASNPVASPKAAVKKAARPAVAKRPSARALKLRAFFEWLLPPVFGVLAMIAVWTLISYQSPNLPGPVSTWHSAVELFSDPFYNNSPNDQGIGWNILASLERVGLGFGLAALIGIPLGFIIGRFQFMSRMAAPIIGILRPVSPLAWLPIGLLVFKAANPAAIWVIFISAIWPMIINTAVGVSKVPQDYMNVAKVLNLSEWKIVTKILFPFVLPYMMTGVRLSIGVAWLVIVAAEMLTGGVGIGFWVWDEWNNLNVEHIIIAIFVVGIVGLLLELALTSLARRFSYE
ncbi:nitrate ABC transporter permease [Methylovorus glucosotrophus]|uniref:Nitrate ABC transporter, inner membrane subunit n=1 Tax=Methylovorus glucosotrophus (strain SIP3-4) TaxID=582744 RepID=C6X8Y2_METGS|nr:nitrate ABC transporter permease [Methylovorus glucosotrophus]ACT49602.1 nitrate ABC transporter, inner membrane subunit [Methylovorus glucosotrophus SIP3-4]